MHDSSTTLPAGSRQMPGSLGDRNTMGDGTPAVDPQPVAPQLSAGDRATRDGEDDAPPTPSDNRFPSPTNRLPVVPGYEILEVLGHGGMGVVYKARHLKLKRLVALKMVLAGVHASQKQIDRFRGEAEAVARLRNAHIIPIYEIGEADDCPYLALEFADGGSLESRINHRPQPQRETAELVRTLAEAIHYCHEQQVVHRDLKPANILLSGGVPKITDFGLAKQLEAETDAAHVATKTGAVLGTPSYMAPEQAKADKGTVGTLADVYALGSILYEMLTGRPPFLGSTPVETIQQVLEAEPVAPVLLQPGLSRDLQTICLKCLEKQPRSRYGSARELAEDLQRFLAGEPIRARAIGRSERAWRWCRRHPALAGLIGSAAMIGMLVLVLSSAFSKLQTTESSLQSVTTEREEAKSETLAANRKRYFSDAPLALAAHRAGQVERAWQILTPHWDAPGLENSKGWEWYYLLSVTHDRLPLEIPNATQCDELSFSGDGRWLAAMLLNNQSRPRQTRTWDVASGRIAFTLENESFPHWVDQGRILCTFGGVYWNGATGDRVSTANLKGECHPSPDGKYIVGEAADNKRPNQLDVVETASGRIVASFPKHLASAGPWSSNGRLWAYRKHDEPKYPEVHIVDVTTGSERALGILTHGSGAASRLAWSPAAPLLAVGGWFQADKQVGPGIQIWNAMTGKLLWKRWLQKDLKAMEWSRDGRYIAAVADFQHEVKVFELNDGTERTIKGEHPLAWSSDSRFLATTADDGIAVWDAEMLTRVPVPPLQAREGSKSKVISLRWSPRASLLAGIAADGKVYHWNALPHEKILMESYSSEWHPQSKFLLGHGQNRIVLRDYDSGREVASLDFGSHGGFGRPLRWSPDGRILAITTSRGKLLLWNPKQNSVVDLPSPEHNKEVRHIGWNADGSLIAYELDRSELVVADARIGKTVATPENTHAPFSWHPDGVRLLGVRVEETKQSLLVWNAATGENIKSIDYAKGVGDVDWTADGNRVVVQPTVHTNADFIDYESGQLLTSCRQAPGAVWNRDYTRLFGAAIAGESSYSRSIGPTLFDGAGERTIATLPGRVDLVPAWNPDGTRCAFLAEGRIVLLEAESGAVVLELPIPKVKDTVGREIVLNPGYLSWSPDGRRLLAGSFSEPYTVIWDASLGYELQSLRPAQEASAKTR